MKIKAKVIYSPYDGYEEGDIFEAEFSDSGESYIFIDNDGDERLRPIEEFEIVEDERAKEKVMKVIALEGCHRNLTAGKIYEVVSKSEGGEYWRVVDDNGYTDGYSPEYNFKLVEDKPKIEAGSKWVSQAGAVLTVNYVGKHQLICTWNDTGKEFASPIKNHLKFYKPKPKTVTMYFYGDDRNLYANQLKSEIVPVLFTREIELP